VSLLRRLLALFTREKPDAEGRPPAPHSRVDCPTELDSHAAEPDGETEDPAEDVLSRIRGFAGEPAAGGEMAPDDDSLVEAVEERLRSADLRLPVLPQTITEVTVLLGDPRASMVGVGRLVGEDQVLTTRILKMANSAFYGGVEPVADVQLAIMRLGLRELRGLLLTIAAETTILKGGVVLPLARRLWEHSVGCAVFCRGLARLVHRDDDRLFVAGLLHDIGKVPILEAVRDVARAEKRSGLPSEEILTHVFDAWHERIGEQVAREWALPEEIVHVIGHHHGRPEGEFEAAMALVAVANRLCHASGEIGSLVGLEAAETAGLSDLTLRDMTAALPEMVEEIAQRLE